DHRAARNGAAGRRVADRAAAGHRRRGDHAPLSRRLGGDRARGDAGAGTVGSGEGHGVDHRGPPALSGRARACARYFLAASIFAKISSSVGNRYVTWLVYAVCPSMRTSKMPPTPSFRRAVMPYLSLMAACKLEASAR